MTIAAEALKGESDGARLVVLDKDLKETSDTVSFRFNPTEYQIQKSNSFADIAIPGLEAPPIQFVRGAGEKLAFELLLDTSQEVVDVRDKYVHPLRNLMNIDSNLHAPPVLRFYWDKSVFTGVMESLSVTYLLFTEQGVPLRAKAQIALKEYRPASVQLRERPRNSPDVEKTYVVQAGDTLSSIAAAAYGEPLLWREIARQNQIRDPRQIDVGSVLRIPRVVSGVRREGAV